MADRRSNIERWRQKNMLKHLDLMRGTENGFFSLIMPYPGNIPKVLTRLDTEHEKASAVEDMLDRSCYIWAIDAAKTRLQELEKVHFEGLCLYTGRIIDKEDNDKEGTTIIDFKPFQRIQVSVYQFADSFNTEALHQQLIPAEKYGIMVMDRKGVMFRTLRGTVHEVLHEYIFPVELRLPYGQNPNRGCLKEVADYANQFYGSSLRGLIIAGETTFMSSLERELNSGLANSILKVVEVEYGGLVGFDGAMNESCDVLAKLRFVIEKKALQYFFHRLSTEEGLSFFGLDDSLKQISSDDPIATLIVWEDLEVMVRVMRDSSGRRKKLEVLGEESKGRDEEWTVEEESISLVYWLANRRNPFNLDIVTNSTAEGMQFCKGFDGIGGLRLTKKKDDDDGDDSHVGDDDHVGDHGDDDDDDDEANFWDE